MIFTMPMFYKPMHTPQTWHNENDCFHLIFIAELDRYLEDRKPSEWLFQGLCFGLSESLPVN